MAIQDARPIYGNYTVFIASPQYTSWERGINERLAYLLSLWGFKVYLPQRDIGELGTGENKEVYFDLFSRNLRSADILVANVAGNGVDGDVAWAMGFCYQKGTPIVVWDNDRRTCLPDYMKGLCVDMSAAATVVDSQYEPIINAVIRRIAGDGV